MVNLEYLVQNSQESILKEYSYSEGILMVFLDLTEIERKVKFKIKTGSLSFDFFYLEKKEELYRTCRIEIEDLLSTLSTENGIYVPSNRFDKLMNESRLNYNLAYGKKSSEFKYLFSLVGYGRLISCVLPDLNCITIMEVDQNL